MKNIRASAGFTIIEVLIVIAIASVIMLALFLTVGPAHRRQHDEERKQGAARLIAALDEYGTSSGKNYAGFSCTTYCKDISDPDSSTHHPVSGSPGVAATPTSGITYVIGGACATGSDAGSSITSSFASRAYAILYWSEGNKTSQCFDNHGGNIAGTGGSVSSGSGDASTYSQPGGTYSGCIPSSDKCMSYGGGAAYTAWAPTQFVYSPDSIASGTNTIKIVYKNSTPLPTTYTAFNINLYANSVKVLSNLSLPVNTDGNAPEPFITNMILPEGVTSLGVEWTNDWCCGVSDSGAAMDANFVLLSISVTK